MASTVTNTVWHSVKTIIGIKNEIAAVLHGSDYNPDLNATLNAKYNLYANEKPTSVPKIGWFGIGINGHFNINDENKSAARVPKMTNMDLYEPIPFVCVPLDEDKADYRIRYRMRTIRNIRGIQYVCYYLKPIQLMDSEIQIVRIDPNTMKEVVYELDTDNLYPVPTAPQTSGVIDGTSADIQVSQKFMMPIRGSEVCEPVSVLYQGDILKARLSEFGIYTGEERALTGYTSENTAFTYNEVICTHLAVHTCITGMDGTNPSNVLDRIVTMTGGNIATLD